MVEGWVAAQVVDLHGNDPKGLHYIFDFVSGVFWGTWNLRPTYARRRARSGLLIQGSVQPPPAPARSEWESALCREMEVAWRPLPAGLLPAELALRLQEEKYAQASFNQKR